MRARRTATTVVSLVAMCALASACGTSDGETTTGTGDTPTSDQGVGSSSDTGGTGSLPDGCHEAPATTAMGMDGGGEIVCDEPDSTGDTVPATTPETTVPIPEGEGVVRGTFGGSPCSRTRTDEPCIEIYELLTGEVTFVAVDGQSAPVTVTVDANADPTATGQFVVTLAPGRWSLLAEPDAADRICDPQEVTVVAGAVTEASILCRAP